MKKLYLFLLNFILLNCFAQAPVMNPITGSSVVCSGPSSYTASASNSPSFYSWFVSPSTGVVVNNASGSVSSISFPNSGGTYTIFCSATNGFGTSSTKSFVVNVFETPNVSFSGSNTFCQGSSTNLSASSTIVSASSTISYNWSPGIGLNTTTGSNVIANPSMPTTYTVTATNNGVCSNTAQITVTPFEMLPVTFSGSNTFCQGSSTNLSANSNIQSANSTVFYIWSPGTGLNTTSGSNVVANPGTSTTYTVTGYYGSCSNTGQITVGPNSFSVPIITASATNSTVCYNDSTTLNASGANTYTWTNSVQNGIPFGVYNSNIYYVTGTDINGCTNTDSVMVTVNPLAIFNITSPSSSLPSGQTSTLTINGNAGISYSLNAVSTSTTIVISPTVTTTYTFTSVNSSGCEYTQIFTQYVDMVMGVQLLDTGLNNYFNVYPNPNNGIFNIKSNTKETIQIINELGEIIRIIELNPGTDYQISNLSSGFYVIHSDKRRVKIIVTQ